MRSRLVALGVTLGMCALLATGCASDPKSVASDLDVSPDQSTLVEGAKKEGKLVWYTGATTEEAAGILAKFKEKYPFIDVSEYYASTAGKILAKLQAEHDANKVQADVVENGDIGGFAQMKEKSWLAEFKSGEMASYEPYAKDEGFWTAWLQTAIVMGYDSTALKGDEIPDSWTDLADPRFKDRIGFQDETSGYQYTQWYVLRNVLGDDFWPSVGDNDPVILGGNPDIIQSVLRGELLLGGQTWSNLAAKFGADTPYTAVFPKEGVPTAVRPVAVLEAAPHPYAARLFVDWLISEEGQTAMLNVVGDYSARSGMPSPEGLPSLSNVQLLPIDNVEDFTTTREQFVQEWRQMTTN